jgi:hypothetical protein
VHFLAHLSHSDTIDICLGPLVEELRHVVQELPKYLMEVYGIDSQFIDIKTKGHGQ